ncbi:hypothetical protein SV7mr_49860 [Stieleria bergensis]|uniref:Uncharacterized protein n=2 Tax=Stieleria bergensis TaxID=2528025 RepID=A0A517T238_9BACT|nr:hypothetical protein SV7mr_49860 [Planctomycetes bacterium SV_7m_r]
MFCVPYLSWSLRNRGIDTSGLGLDGVNQVQMILREIPEVPQSRYRTPGEILTTVKQNVLWHGLYHLPQQSVPGLAQVDISSMRLGKYIALTLCVLGGLLIVPYRWYGIPIWLAVLPMLVLILPLSIGGSARYWFPISTLFTVLGALNLCDLMRYLCEWKLKVICGKRLALLVIVSWFNGNWNLLTGE